MEFLYINGAELKIKVNPNPNYSIIPIGSFNRTADGSLNGTSLKNIKQWKFTTGYQTQAEMLALVGVISGEGNIWSFNDTLYCGKGLPSTFIRASTAYKTDGSSVLSGAARFENGPLYSNFPSDKSISVYEGTTNLLTANQASIETDTTGFTQIGGGTVTITKDAVEHWHGLYALKVVTDGSAINQGIKSSPRTTVTANLYYTFSLWVKGSGAVYLALNERTATGVDVGTTSSSVITLTSTWTKYSVSRLFGATGERAEFQVYTQGTQSLTFYCDGNQLESKPYMTSFQLPGTSRANESLYLTTPKTDIANTDGLTIGAWVNVNEATKYIKTTEFSAILSLLRSNNTDLAIVLIHSSTFAEWRLNTYSDSGTSFTVNGVADSLTPNGWHFFVGTIDYYNGISYLYVDGVLRGTATNILKPTTIGTRLYVGSANGSSSFLNSQIGAAFFYPYQWTNSMISGFYALNRMLRTPPFFEVYGDEINRTASNPLICFGQIEKIDVISFGLTRKYLTSFSLTEA